MAGLSVACSFDAKGEAADSGAVHLQIIDFAICKQPLDSSLECSIVNTFLRDELSAPRISLKRACASTKFFGKPALLVVSGTFFRVHVNRPGLRQFFHASEPVICEQDGLVDLWRNQPQAMTAWRRVGC
jgi:hypothetical protein